MEIFIILGLVLLNAFFSLAEIALISSKKPRLESQANKGDDKARKALALINKPEVFISTVQIGITFVGILTGIFSGNQLNANLKEWITIHTPFAAYSHIISVVVIVLSVTFISLVFGELVPKRIGLSNAEKIAKWVTPIMNFLLKIAYPFVWVVNNCAKLIISLLGIEKNQEEVSEEEIKAMINEGTLQGTFEVTEGEIIERVLGLGDRNITSLMTHKNDIVWLEINRLVDNIEKEYDLHSVYPVCEGSIDDVKGVVYMKDLFVASRGLVINEFIRPAFYVPETMSVYILLEKFKLNKLSYAIIVDEYGSVLGMITLHDILISMVGDIGDSTDEEPEMTERTDGSFLVDGQMPFYEFLDHFDLTDWMDEQEDEDFDTVAGFLLHHLEHIPKVGETFEWRCFTFEVVDMDGHRIDKILAIKQDDSKKEEDTDDENPS